MKNCIFFKFLAILLCAASLMGVVGGTAGALVLVEGDLYNRTVDQMLDERFQENAVGLAEQAALGYASRELGGCPDDITWHYFINNLGYNYGYAILDPEGNVLESQSPELKDIGDTYTIPVTGQYMHLVSTETESQAKAAEVQKQLETYGALADADGETVPAEGIAVNHVIFTGQEGYVLYEASSPVYRDNHTDYTAGTSTYFYRDYLLDNGAVESFSNTYTDHAGRNTGFLFYNAAGQLAYTSFLSEEEKPFATTVYGVLFHNTDQGFTFQLDNPEGLGTLSNESGTLLFTAFAQAVPEAINETAAAEVSETLPPETVPQTETTEVTTVPAETTPETLWDEETEAAEEYAEETHWEDNEEEASSASADPEEPDNGEAHQEQEIDWDYYDYKADQRILFDWLLSRNLITEEALPDDLLSDEALQQWLVAYELIDPSQSISPPPAPPEETLPPETVPEETVETIPETTEPVLINGKPLEAYQINHTEYVNPTTGEQTTAKYIYLPLPELAVEVYIDRATMDNAALYSVLKVLRQYRDSLLPIIGISFLLFALSALYLCTAAGCKPKIEKVQAGGLNRIPLDLYLVAGLSIAGIFMALIFEGVPVLLKSDFQLGGSLAAASIFGCCLIFTGFCFAFVAQVKTGGGFWWRSTLTVRFTCLCLRFIRKLHKWMQEDGFPWLKYICLKIWHWSLKVITQLWNRTGKFLARIGKKLNHFFSLIPMTWQWLLGGLTIILFSLLVSTHNLLLILLGILVPLAIVLYVTHCFGILYASTKRMSKGNLDTKIESKLMTGCFKSFASDLNDLADVAMVAAQKQLKSERMKTELITNVSHDIKTPLTSIINYVDLLQKPHTEEEAEQYLEVLDRQSQRLKKLVEDLMDMSKASTGNMAVEITRLDAVEAVNQALGEFSDKLDRAHLYPVFRHSEDSVPILADGKLVWRVLSNLLSNVIKYAMPGTRIYLDLTHVNKKVIISLKNISREELNINAEELMERFVRGDLSRNTEGSGLGLNIAKSLMELQKGTLQLLVDGDLFKVTLIFPDAE